MARRTPRRPREDHERQRFVDAAARIMAEEGVRDFQLAKRKAAARLNLPEGRNWPANFEIERALEAHLALFHTDIESTRQRLREAALALMTFFEHFEPRLVGQVLTGWVTKFSVVQLHARADTPEEFDLFLQEHGIPFEQTGRRYRFGGDRVEEVPTFHFSAEDVPIEVSLFDNRTCREAPLSPIDGRPMVRANRKDLQALMTAPAARQPF